jgi:excisionase family DNA binding protein
MKPTPTPPPTLTRLAYGIDEAAALMGLSSRHIYRLVWSGELRGIRSGRRVLIPAESIQTYLASPGHVETR